MKQNSILCAVAFGLVSCHDSSKNSGVSQTSEPGAGANHALATTTVRNRRSHLDAGANPHAVDTIKKESDYVVLGDSNELLNADNLRVALKFKQYIHFADLPAAISPVVAHVPIQYSSHPWARQFRTVISEAYNQEGVNFAGHYCFVYWGCGSTCQLSVLVDVRTGRVYEGVDAGGGYSFKKDSRLLIANPPDSSGLYVSLKPRVYAWNEAEKTFKQRE